MRQVAQVNGWTGFTNAAQDQPPVIVQNVGGLYTRNLMNCMCLVVTNGRDYAMMHLNPGHPQTVQWGQSMLQNIDQPTEALVSGANFSALTRPAELTQIFQAYQNVRVTDETKTALVPPNVTANVVQGQALLTGYVAVNATTDEYVLSASDFPDTLGAQPQQGAPRARRGACDGICIIL